MLVLTRRLPPDAHLAVQATLALTADERSRSRHRFTTTTGEPVYLNLPRSTVLYDGDLLQTDSGDAMVRVQAKPEPVLTVTAESPLLLLRAAYHLGNRHVALEVAPAYLRLSPNPVLEDMLHQMGVTVVQEIVPFQPEAGAYGHHHSPTHARHEKHGVEGSEGVMG